jgi:hypothetical protein
MTYPPQYGGQPPYPPGGGPWQPYPNPNPPPLQQLPPVYSAPYGQPYPGSPFAPNPYAPPKRSKKGLWIALGLLGALAVIAVAVVVVINLIGPSDQEQITSTINNFAEAVDKGNLPKAVTFMCSEEAQQVTERHNYDANSGDTMEPTNRLPVNVTDVHVTGDTATAQLTRPPQKAQTLHLKKEAGAWKLCDPGAP